MTYANGQVAEMIIKSVLRELGWLANCPVSYEQVLDEMENNTNRHFQSALAGIIESEGSLNVGVNTLVDYALACDGFFEDRDGNIVSYDVTTNNSVYTMNHKYNVQDIIKGSKFKLRLGNHIIVVLQSSKPYRYLSDAEKYKILDTLLDTAEIGLSVAEVRIVI